MSWDKLYTGRNYALYHNTGEITVYYKYSTVKGVIHKSHGKPTTKLRVSTVNYISRKPTTKLRVSTENYIQCTHTLKDEPRNNLHIFSMYLSPIANAWHQSSHHEEKDFSVCDCQLLNMFKETMAQQKSVWQNF